MITNSMAEKVSPIFYNKDKHQLVFDECTEEEARNDLKQIQSALKLQELVKKQIKFEQKEAEQYNDAVFPYCVGVLKFLLRKSKK